MATGASYGTGLAMPSNLCHWGLFNRKGDGMKNTTLLATSILALATAIGCEEIDDIIEPNAQEFSATLNGASERPTPVATTASGTATFRLSPDADTLSWVVSMTNTNNVIMAHIHVGGAEVAGPIALLLFAGTAVNNPPITGFVTRAAFTSPLGITFDALLDLMRNGGTYVNVHTDNGVAPPNQGPGDFPGGEIRGQISRNP